MHRVPAEAQAQLVVNRRQRRQRSVDSHSEDFLIQPILLTGWVGVVWSKQNILMNTRALVDRLESRFFLADYS